MTTFKTLAMSVISIYSFSLAPAQTFTLKSKDLSGQMTNQQIFNGMDCTGQNLSPELSWENVPAGTKSFAVTIYDKDAPTGAGFWHWVVFDLPVNTTELKQGAGDASKNLLPTGAIQGMTSFGAPGYGGGCPPKGDRPHQYLVTVYALKVEKLGLDNKATSDMVGFYLENNSIAKASLVVYAKR